MEEILIKYVKEKGIVKIIIEYKEDIESYEREEIIHILSMRLVDDIIKDVNQFLKFS